MTTNINRDWFALPPSKLKWPEARTVVDDLANHLLAAPIFWLRSAALQTVRDMKPGDQQRRLLDHAEHIEVLMTNDLRSEYDFYNGADALSLIHI